MSKEVIPLEINQMKINALNNHQIQNRILQQSKENSFSKLLNEKLENREVRFSKHAMERAAQRGIPIENSLVRDISSAVDKARAKGIKDVVVIGKQGAFVVNVTNSTVITSMDTMEMKNNIFTNIDGAVMI